MKLTAHQKMMIAKSPSVPASFLANWLKISAGDVRDYRRSLENEAIIASANGTVGMHWARFGAKDISRARGGEKLYGIIENIINPSGLPRIPKHGKRVVYVQQTRRAR